MSETSPSAGEKMSLKTWAQHELGQAVQQNCLENLTKSAKLPGGVGAGGTLNFLRPGHLKILKFPD